VGLVISRLDGARCGPVDLANVLLVIPASAIGAAASAVRVEGTSWPFRGAGVVPRKVMFGTNYPMITVAKALEGLDDLGLDDDAKASFWAGACAHQSIEQRFCKPHQQASSRLFFC
jgi:hypothetical protein